MFAGHVGAAMAIGSAERRVNLGVLVGAAVLLDALLWIMVLLGVETVILPPDPVTHQPAFVFPWSHGLLASLGWSALAAAATWLWRARLGPATGRVALCVAAAVLSHWLLDALVHRPEMPLAGAGSARVGLGLWQAMPVALCVEAAIAAGGLALFVSGSRLSRARRVGLSVLVLVVLVLTVAGMTVAPPPPSAAAMAVSSLVAIAVVCALAAWLAAPSA